MADSLKDQLLKAGLADAKKAKKQAKEKRKAANVARRSGASMENDSSEAARKVREEKVERDRELNRVRNEQAQLKAINAQILQLIDNHKVDRKGGEINFHFTDNTTVKKLYVTSMQQKHLAAGKLAIAKQGEAYELLPIAVAEKIAQRDSTRVIVCTDANAEALTEEEQEWYKDYEIPDDLMW